MRSRLPLYLDSLSLEEIFFLEAELAHYREKFRGCYTVLAAWTQADLAPIVGAGDEATLGGVTWLRKLYRLGAAAGGGALLIFHPETSLFLFRDVPGASRSVAHLTEGFSAFGGVKFGRGNLPWCFGMATGEDFLAEDSPRALGKSVVAQRAVALVKRASHATLLLDDLSYRQWPCPENCRPVGRANQTCWEVALACEPAPAAMPSNSCLPAELERDEPNATMELEESRRRPW